MSNYLAIATATASLRALLEDVVTGVVAGAEATVARPGDTPDATPSVGANVFLYGITPNAAHRNADLPARRGGGGVAQRPAAAVDLHYLISFYGDDRVLETHRMLGAVVRTLHARPTLPRELLRQVAQSTPHLNASDLAESPEPVRLSPVLLNLEELSKLWSVLFQVPYALSVAYQASVVTLEADETPAPRLPVQSRGIHTVQFGQPVVESVEPQTGRRAPILPDSVLVIQGQRLRGDRTRVRIAGHEVEAAHAASGEIRVPLATLPPGTLRAGVQPLQVVHERMMGTPPRPHRGGESNVAPFVLRPVIARTAEDEPDVQVLPADGDGPRRIRVRVAPRVGTAQNAVLLLNASADPEGRSFALPLPRRAADGDVLAWPVGDVPPGTYLVRVQVDGAESPLERGASGGYAGPEVTL
ncbi:MAG TPA: DUF4255 domain-containing protein [Longimicrobium sp.]|jgi:hypothetical protein|uniref:DUF4255 domain-containing protein n=1 Tax=Longimicrobium sp. TaxID=2029185 RepID=UPI002ED96312